MWESHQQEGVGDRGGETEIMIYPRTAATLWRIWDTLWEGATYLGPTCDLRRMSRPCWERDASQIGMKRMSWEPVENQLPGPTCDLPATYRRMSRPCWERDANQIGMKRMTWEAVANHLRPCANLCEFHQKKLFAIFFIFFTNSTPNPLATVGNP